MCTFRPRAQLERFSLVGPLPLNEVKHLDRLLQLHNTSEIHSKRHVSSDWVQ
uniref:Uncharacterized protein n=1 Tax=Anguilla anguilla TaxID=7936 RepID=A0A0E9PYL0_ANGAN